jgi:hypothetical protein
MRALGSYLPALACLAMMAVICIPMLLSHRKHNNSQVTKEPDINPELAELREEVALLKARLTLDDDKAHSETLDG